MFDDVAVRKALAILDAVRIADQLSLPLKVSAMTLSTEPVRVVYVCAFAWWCGLPVGVLYLVPSMVRAGLASPSRVLPTPTPCYLPVRAFFSANVS